MGILANAVAIIVGVFIGSVLKKGISVKKFAIFGISVSIISLVSFIENIFEVSEHNSLKGEYLYLLIFALVIGYFLGEALKLDELFKGKSEKEQTNQAFSQAAIFFVVGGLQISGAILFLL